ncbi:MAG: fatty acid desaturase CarF family protein [Pseudomonadales bacterium]
MAGVRSAPSRPGYTFGMSRREDIPPDSAAADRERIRRLTSGGAPVAEGRGAPAELAACWAAVVVAVAALCWLGWRNPAIWWVLPLALLVLDFLSGLVHWLFDTRIPAGDGLLGRIAVNFLDHHVNPTRTAEVGFAATSWRVAVYVSLPLLGLALLLPAGAGQAWLYWMGALSLLVAQAHKVAHKRQPGRLARVLQRLHLSLSPRSHRQHHRDHGRAYCVFTGWCNPLLDRSGFWRWLERICPVGAIKRPAAAAVA